MGPLVLFSDVIGIPASGKKLLIIKPVKKSRRQNISKTAEKRQIAFEIAKIIRQTLPE